MKIWSKLVLVLAAGTLMFSGCLENIEPEGIKDLRGAKAELLRAKTALEEANAAKVNAEAAFVQAQAKIQEAIAKQEEAKAVYEAAVARLKELEAEKAAAMDAIEIEKAMAEAKAAIAEAEARAAAAAAELERDLLRIQAEIAANQAALDRALKDLAIAKNTLTPHQQAALAALEVAVTAARDDVEEKTVALEEAASYLADVLAEIESPKALALATKMLELEIVKAKSELEAYQLAEAKAKALLELDPAVADWDAQVEAIEAEIDALALEVAKHTAEKSEAYAVYADSLELVEYLAETYTAITGYELLETGYFSKVKGDATDPEIVIPGEIVVIAPVDDEGNSLFGGDFIVEPKYNYGEEDVFIKKFEDKVKALNKINAKSYEAQIAIEEAKAAAAKEDPRYKFNVQKYNDAVAAYKAGDVLPYFSKYVFDEEFDLTVAVKEYNDALKAVETTVKNFNDAYDKYNPDFNEEYDAAMAAWTKAVADAAAVKAQEYQKAQDDYNYAYHVNTYYEAMAVWSQAYSEWAMTVSSIEDYWGVTEDQMKDFVANYNAETATDDEAWRYDGYIESLAEIKAANAIKAEADMEWDAAEKAFAKVDEAYYKAIAAADEKEAKAQDKAREAYEKAAAAIAEKTPYFDWTYQQNLYEQVYTAVETLSEKVAAVRSAVTYDFTDKQDTYYIDFELNSGSYYRVSDVPEYMVDITVDTEGTHYAAVPVAVADFVDLNCFKNNVVAALANQLTTVIVYYTFDYWDEYGDMYTYYIAGQYHAYDSYSYPLELPTADEFAEYVEEKEFDVIPEWVWNTWVNATQGLYYGYTGINVRVNASPMYAETVAAIKIADLKADIENLKKLPDFVKAIEAAKAEVEAFMAETTASVEEMKAVVEAFMPKFNELMADVLDKLYVLVTKVNILTDQYETLKGIIEAYTGYETVAEFTKALEDAYYEAVEDTYWAEYNVCVAEQDLADLKAGVVSAAEWAQRTYDRAAEELAEAIAKLERATTALENVIAAIYETGEVPETPETPETPEGDEGGEETPEGGEEGGEEEGGEETPAE